MKLSVTKKQRTRENMSTNWKSKELRMKRKEKYNDSVNCKKKLLIDKLKLMRLEPSEPSKKVSDKPEKERDLNNRRNKESLLTLRLLGIDSLLRNNLAWPSKPELSVRIT
jgi:hypothetical protein